METPGAHRSLSTQAMLTTASRPERGSVPSSQSSAAISRKDMPSTTITFMLLRTMWAWA